MDSQSMNNRKDGISRRKFISSTSAVMGGILLSPLQVRGTAFAAGNDTLKLVLIGSGSRGTGAAVDALRADKGLELVALVDVFQEIADQSLDILLKIDDIKDRVKIPEEHKFVGLDAYKDAIDLADVVILATPPAFRPQHFEYTVNNGKHVFMEKPLACDAPGIRRILASGKLAEEKGLSVVVGLQYRYSKRFQNIVKEVHDGRIGDITSMSCNYLLPGIRLFARKEGDTEMEYQLRNWRFFEWLWGGSPAGLTIHFEDIAHWAKCSYPVRAFGTGGRVALDGPQHGDIFDTYYIEYEYEDGTRLHSRTRHIQNCWTNRSVSLQGSLGSVDIPAMGVVDINNLNGESQWRYDDSNEPNPYLAEHIVLFDSIRNGKPVNDTDWAARSSMTSILGRMAVHSGKKIEWDEALNSELVLVPDDLTFDSDPPVLPLENGNYPFPVPGGSMRVF